MKKLKSSIYRYVSDRPRFDWVFFGLLIALYVGLSFWNITAGSIWFDEAFSAYIIQYNFIDIARYTAADVHPPLYYWLLQGWAAIFGHTEIGLRSMSVFFGVIAATFGYLWMQRQFGRRVALVSLGILVLSPLFIRYSQEARMYTLAAAIVLAATYVMTRALEEKKRWQWVTYGLLIAAGMLTHYFTALAWIAHWVWRFIIVRQSGARGPLVLKKFFSKEWLLSYGLAVGIFLAWLPAMVIQLTIIQSTGFWIGDVGIDTVGSYFGTLVYFWQSNQITNWFAAALIAVGIVVAVLAPLVYRKLNKAERRSYLLLFLLAAVPPVLLFIASLPPLTSSFVERYLLPAAIASAFFAGLVLTRGFRGRHWQQGIVAIAVVGMLVTGLVNMYSYNNYNKNSRTDVKTQQVVEQIVERSAPGIPIVSNTPWVFYEAVFYNSAEHPIYFLDESTDYEFGSLDMLKESDDHKIIDLDAFAKEHPVFWYMGYSQDELTPPRADWTVLDQVSVTSSIDGQTVYRGIKVQAN